MAAIILASASGLLPKMARAEDEKSKAPARKLECIRTDEKQHVLGALYEHQQALGLRYHHTHLHAAGCGEGVLLWGSYGLDLRFVSDGFERSDAGLAMLSGRVGSFPGAGIGFSLELGAGGGPTRDGARALGFVGGFASFYFVDLGAVTFFPLGPFDRPSWLNDVSFGARIHVPLKTYDERVEHYGPAR